MATTTTGVCRNNRNANCDGDAGGNYHGDADGGGDHDKNTDRAITNNSTDAALWCATAAAQIIVSSRATTTTNNNNDDNGGGDTSTSTSTTLPRYRPELANRYQPSLSLFRICAFNLVYNLDFMN